MQTKMCPITWFRSSVNQQIRETLNEILSVVDQSQQTTEVEKVKIFVTERLAAAAEEISVVFERAIRDYQKEIERQRKLLDIVFKRDMTLHREDAQHLFVCKEEPSPRVDQEEPESPHIKEEQDEPGSGRKREQPPGLEETDIIKFTFNPENSEEKQLTHPKQCKDNREPESLAGTSTRQMKTESEEEDWGLSEADSNLDPAGGFKPTRECQPLSSDRSESETDEDEWKETKKPPPGLRTVDSEMSQRAEEQNFSASEELSNELNSTCESQSSFCCKVCGKFYPTKKSLMSHVKGHSRDCGLCGKHLELGESLKLHFEVHKTCDFCSKKCATICDLEKHLLVHTKEKPFSCSICKKEFAGKYTLKIHMRLHTGEKPYTCVVCHKSFTQTGSLKIHMRYHTGERPFSCTVCKKDFIDRTHLNTHMRQHTGEKPYSCAFCIKSYRRNSDLKTHMKIHMVGTSDGNTNVPFYYGPLVRPCNVTTNLMLQSSIHYQ